MIKKILFWIVPFLAISGAMLLAGDSPSPSAVPPFALDAPDSKMPALPFQLEDQDGKIIQLKDFQGKAILINFWASWCRPCLQEMPSLNRLAQALEEEGFVVLAVNVQEHETRAKRFLKKMKLPFLKIAFDKKENMFLDYQIFQLPTSFLIDREGNFVARIRGVRDWDSKESIAYFQK